MSYYVGQSNILLTLDTKIPLVGATATRILYTKPNGLKGFWPATVVGTTLEYQLLNNDVDQAGVWKIQAYVEISGRKAYGQITEVNFDKPLN